jgi:hypothetical protein
MNEKWMVTHKLHLLDEKKKKKNIYEDGKQTRK